ncbi:MAG: thiamine pyrophosphate-dependent dehydrogenase E1 component subunit alpha [Planctomycetes bacterium]|nr:thiamine pyrophosphate-dependent dehydrogenase E1 component subunit alpha [Planctomycetota bacterium]
MPATIDTEALGTERPELGLVQILDEEGGVAPGAALPVLDDERLRDLYRHMCLLRAIDVRLEGLQRMGRIGFFGSARGQEASVIGTGAALEQDDWVFPALRESGVMLLRGWPLSRYFAHMFGNQLDPLRGRMQPMHFAAREVNQVSWGSCMATQLPQAVGAAYGMKLKRRGQVAIAYIGDGGTSEHDFHAALTFAGVWKVPAVFVVQNNQWAISVPVARQTASATIAVKAVAYGMPGVRVDGNDLLAVYRETKAAVDRARRGEGPTLLELVTFRMGGHSSADDPTRYRDARLVEEWAARCPLKRLRAFMEATGRWSEADEEAMAKDQRAALNAAVAEAEKVPPPPPADLVEDVFAAPTPALLEQRGALEEELAEREAKRRGS